jgi:fatty-acyl-CoA synthase
VDPADVPLQRLDLSVGGERGRRHAPCACARSTRPQIFALIASHRVTHLCGAPIVLNMLVHSPQRPGRAFDPAGGGRPRGARRRRPAVIEAMESMGFRVTHLYGSPKPTGPRHALPMAGRLGIARPRRRAGKDGAPGRADATQEELAVLDVETARSSPPTESRSARSRCAATP